MKKFIMAIVCLMTMVITNAHNTHYPTYTIDGITYAMNGTWDGKNYFWEVQKVHKSNERTIVIPSRVAIDEGQRTEFSGEELHVATIGKEAFSECVSLDSLIICDGITLGTCRDAFKGCNKLEYLYYSNGGYCGKWGGNDMTYNYLSCKTLETSLGCCEKPFWDAIKGSLEKIIIRETNGVHTLMDECPHLKTIVCYATNPPYTYAAKSPYVYTCAGGYITFVESQWATITLYVPRESLTNYYFDKVWGEIDNIYAIDEMNVIDETDNTNNTPIVSETNPTTSINAITNTIADDIWYSLNGTKVDKPTNGVYIKNGKKYIIN